MNLLSVLLPFAILLLSMLPAFYEILRRKDRGPRATYQEKRPAETQDILREAEELLREAEELLGEDDGYLSIDPVAVREN